MLIGITGVVRNGAVPPGTIEPRVPFPQLLEVPRGEDVIIKLTVIGQDGLAVDISAGAIKFGLRRYRGDEAPMFVVPATVTNGPGGLADIVVPSAGTLVLSERFAYLWDIQWTDGASKRWQLVSVSRYLVSGIVVRPTE